MSYAATTTITPTNASDAQFRAWGSAISSKLSSMGLVNTADTGQINWTTVLAPLAINTVQGYEIWRFADTLQSTAPVFIKLEYGSGSSANNPAIWLTLGGGSNGTGTLTGVPNTRTQFTFTLTSTPITAYWSGDTNRAVFAFVGAASGNCFLFSLERTLDTTGALTSEGVLITLYAASAFAQMAWNCTTGQYTTYESTLGALGPANTPLGTTGTQVAIYPVFHNKGVFLPYGLNVMACVNTTVGAGSTIAFTVYGATHTFMPPSSSVFTGALQRTSAASSGIIIRYE